MHDVASPTDRKRGPLAALVRERREALGLTQVDLSDQVGMSQEWASNIETGKVRTPRIKTLNRLAGVLGVDVDELVVASGYAQTKAGANRLSAIAEPPELYRTDAQTIEHVRTALLALVTVAEALPQTPEIAQSLAIIRGEAHKIGRT